MTEKQKVGVKRQDGRLSSQAKKARVREEYSRLLDYQQAHELSYKAYEGSIRICHRSDVEMGCPARIYPLSQPKNYEPPVPRWSLRLSQDVEHIYIAYVGVQSHITNEPPPAQAVKDVESWIAKADERPLVVDSFTVVDGHDVPHSRVWACYWTDKAAWGRSMERLRLTDLHGELGQGRSSVGLWCETFSTPVERLETNYSGLDHAPGLASLPNTDRLPHKLTAYWGAARDRVPASAYDRFEITSASDPPAKVPAGIGEHLEGSNYENMVHIRSGQYWVNCNAEEREAYESTLEPTLMAGMGYLWENPVKTGTLGLRFLRNLGPDQSPLNETCGAGFFRNLADLEQWAKRHPSHLAIFNGAHRHAKAFGDERKFRTWHEVSVLKAGEAQFEYVNCLPRTGVIRFVNLKKEPLAA